MASDFKRTLENCKIVAFDCYTKTDGKKNYSLGVLQGREHCGMMSCDESIGAGFDLKTMFDKPCRLIIRTIGTGNGAWDVITGVDFIRQQGDK